MNLKKIVCFVLIAGTLLASFDADAQKRRGKKRSSRGRGKTEKPMQLGFTAGYQAGGPINAASAGYTMGMLGFTVGGYGQFRLADKVALSAQLNYSFHKFSGGSDNSNGSGMLSYTQHAIAVPIMAKFYPAKFFYLEAGIEPRVNLGDAKGKTASIMGVQLGDNMSATVPTNVFELGVGGGLGFDFGKFFFGMRVMYGVLPYAKLANTGISFITLEVNTGTVSANNLFYGLHLGFKF
ncbi:MAG: PorT family protein [Bacteroidales bacterium]|nr:PorT family protein [Bacteroidales bacterium]